MIRSKTKKPSFKGSKELTDGFITVALNQLHFKISACEHQQTYYDNVESITLLN